MAAKKRTKQIYRYVNVLDRVCYACNGGGKEIFFGKIVPCSACKGSGGKWKQVRELVGEEVIE